MLCYVNLLLLEMGEYTEAQHILPGLEQYKS